MPICYRNTQKNREKTLLFIGLFAVVSIAVYCLYLSHQLEKSEALAEDLISSLNENYDKLHDVTYSLKQLKQECNALKMYDSHSSYLSYTTNATELLHIKINEIIEIKSKHYGVKWIADGTKFINPSLAFVSYNDGHDSYQILVQVLKIDEGYAFQELK